jgi:hypothetical protein
MDVLSAPYREVDTPKDGCFPFLINGKSSDVGTSVFVMGYPLRASMSGEIYNSGNYEPLSIKNRIKFKYFIKTG